MVVERRLPAESGGNAPRPQNKNGRYLNANGPVLFCAELVSFIGSVGFNLNRTNWIVFKVLAVQFVTTDSSVPFSVSQFAAKAWPQNALHLVSLS